jgi:hypothetical protein
MGTKIVPLRKNIESKLGGEILCNDPRCEDPRIHVNDLHFVSRTSSTTSHYCLKCAILLGHVSEEDVVEAINQMTHSGSILDKAFNMIQEAQASLHSFNEGVKYG